MTVQYLWSSLTLYYHYVSAFKCKSFCSNKDISAVRQGPWPIPSTAPKLAHTSCLNPNGQVCNPWRRTQICISHWFSFLCLEWLITCLQQWWCGSVSYNATWKKERIKEERSWFCWGLVSACPPVTSQVLPVHSAELAVDTDVLWALWEFAGF